MDSRRLAEKHLKQMFQYNNNEFTLYMSLLSCDDLN